MKIFIYVLALVLCSNCVADGGPKPNASRAGISMELKSQEESTEAGKRLANTKLSFTRFFQTGSLRPVHVKKVTNYLLIKSIIVYDTADPASTPARAIRFSYGGQIGYIDFDELPAFFKAINYYKKLIALWKNKRQHFYDVQYRTRDNLVVGFYQEQKEQFPYITFDKYIDSETVIIRRCDVDALIRAVSRAMEMLENYHKDEQKPPVFE